MVLILKSSTLDLLHKCYCKKIFYRRVTFVYYNFYQKVEFNNASRKKQKKMIFTKKIKNQIWGMKLIYKASKLAMTLNNH